MGRVTPQVDRLGYLLLTQGWLQAAASSFRVGHDQQIRSHGEWLSDGTTEVFVKREQGKGLQFTINAPKFLLDAVNGVKETAAVHIKPAAAQTPVCSQQKMKAKNAVFVFIESPPANQAKVCDIVLVLSAPDAPAVFPGAVLKSYLTHVPLLRHAGFKTRKTGPENIPEHTITRALLALHRRRAQSFTLAKHTRLFGYRDGF